MDRKAWFIDFAKIAGRKNLRKYFISVVKSILCCHYGDEAKQEMEIRNALEAMDEAMNDKSLPWDVTDAKKSPTAMEDPREISQPQCTIDISKIEQLVDRVWAEETMRSVENA